MLNGAASPRGVHVVKVSTRYERIDEVGGVREEMSLYLVLSGRQKP
jgi:hypothetical protein